MGGELEDMGCGGGAWAVGQQWPWPRDLENGYDQGHSLLCGYKRRKNGGGH